MEICMGRLSEIGGDDEAKYWEVRNWLIENRELLFSIYAVMTAEPNHGLYHAWIHLTAEKERDVPVQLSDKGGGHIMLSYWDATDGEQSEIDWDITWKSAEEIEKTIETAAY